MIHSRKITAAGVALLLALSGCWGNSDSDPAPVPPSTSVPASAGANTAAFVAYIVTLSRSDESTEPLTIDSTFAVPPDETSEPTPLT
jgi:hypothetical protein